MDTADDWIAERAGPGAIVMTADIPLAGRCIKAGAAVIAPDGSGFSEDAIGMALATRNLMDDLRGGGARSPAALNRSRPATAPDSAALDQAIVRLKRAGFPSGGS